MTRNLLRLSCLFLLASVTGCATDAASGSEDDAGGDAPADLLRDSERDLGNTDLGPDVGADADAGPDLGADVGDTAPEVVEPGRCGDGRLDPGEQCDDGPDNDDALADACRTTCDEAACGDGVVDTGERCDDGNDDDTDACSNACQRPATDLCEPCDDDDECGGDLDGCVALDDGSFCGLDCRADRDCPDGFICGDVRSSGGAPIRHCVPATGGCGECFDPDRDGFGVGVCPQTGTDCEPSEGDIFPGAVEACDGLDNDCDGDIDEGVDTQTWYADRDRDGHGSLAESQDSCAKPASYVASSDDCDDAAPFVYTGAPELCDGEDNDCDENVDEDTAATNFYLDADGDGFGAAGAAPTSTCDPLIGYVTNDDDCDDGNSLVRPSAAESCGNSIDDDCSGAVDCADAACASTPACAGGCTDDGFEENDTRDEASPLGSGSFPGFVSCPGDDDFYALELAVGDEVAIAAAFSHADGDVDIALLDLDGRVVAASSSVTDNEAIDLTVATSGSYFLRVRLFSDAGRAGNTYALTVGLDRPTPSCRDDGFEDNDTRESSAAAPAGTTPALVSCPGDPDFFTQSLGAGDTITVGIAFSNAGGDLDLRLVGDDGRVVAESEGVSDAEEVTYTATRAGVVAIEIAMYGDAGDPGNGYSLTVDIERAAPTCDDDGFEENDALSEAAAIAEGVYDALTVCTGDADFYAVNLAAGATVGALVEFSTLDGDIDVNLFDPAGVLVASSTSLFGSSEAVEYEATVSGEHVIEVALALDLFGEEASYDLTVEVVDPPVTCVDDALEENDLVETAARVGEGTTPELRACLGDSDFYAVALGAGDTLSASVDFSHSAGDIDLVLLSPAGAVVASAVSTTDDESFTYVAPAAGTYAVRVYLFSDSGDPGNQYALSIDIAEAAPTCSADRLENNDDRAGAEPLPPELYTRLNVCSDDEDWYRITASAGDSLRVTAEFDTADGDIDLQLLDAAGRVLDSSATVDGEEVVELSDAEAGDYFVRVWLYSDAGDGFGATYSIEVDVTPASTSCVDDDFEDNDTTAAGVFADAGFEPDLRLCPGDADVFTVFLLEGETVTATVDFAHADGDVDLALLDADGATLNFSTSTTDSESVSLTATEDGIYHLRVYLYADAGSAPGNGYDLTIDIDRLDLSCPADDRLEPNDTPADAVDLLSDGYLGGMIACSGDSDYFDIVVFPGETLTVEVAFSNAAGDIDLELLDDAGDLLDESDGTEDSELVTFSATALEIVTIRVLLFDEESAGSPYEMLVTLL